MRLFYIVQKLGDDNMITSILARTPQRVNNTFFLNVRMLELGLKQGICLHYHHLRIKYFIQ